ncbi:MAG: glycosyltransferase family 4 protein [Candidatus Melainabacteria bacterium]|nr:MAG: glycosyltransferase family 4 protein [Candidatus Melainabacteria bacterium]
MRKHTLRIAQVAANTEPVPPQGYGGTELVVSLLTEELVKRGHEVTLFAAGTSITKAKLVTVVDQPLRAGDRYNMLQWPAFDMQTLIELENRQDQFDIVHSHMSWTALPFLDRLKCARLTTMHNQVKGYCEDIYLRYKHLPYVAISDSFRSLNKPDQLNYVGTVYNGIKVEDFHSKYKNDQRDSLLFIGRLCKDKGTAEALDIAKQLNLPITVAGKVDKNDESYFEQEVKPRLANGDANFIGEVNHEQKVELYGKAMAVVYPINFNEPFGLVMAEALAAGTPVMAFDRGSVREILDDPKTAIIGSSVEQLVRRFPELKNINRNDCVERVQKLFSVEKMVDAYEAIYEQLLNKRNCELSATAS